MNIKEKNSNHGITLIALVITIIVMLILVAVTITMAVNGGLFGKAADAGKKTNEAVALEQELGSGKIKIKDGSTIYEYETVNDYFTNTPSKVYEDGEQLDPETPGANENIQIIISGANEVDVKNTITLTAESEGASIDSNKIEWTSSNPQVATVANGVVTGVNASINEGKATIIAKYNNKEVGNKEITVNPVLVDCPLCSKVKNPDREGFCNTCQPIYWGMFTNNAELIASFNSHENSNYSNLLSGAQKYEVLPIVIIDVKMCLGCADGEPVSCGYCNEVGQLYDMGIDYKRVAQ